MSDLKESNNKLTIIVFTCFFILILYLLWGILAPFLGAFIFALILAGAIYPVQEFFCRKYKLSRQISGAIVTGIIILAILIPLTIISLQLSRETLILYKNFTSFVDNKMIEEFFHIEGFFGKIANEIYQTLNLEYNPASIKTELYGHAQSALGYIANALNEQVKNIFAVLFNIIVMTFSIYMIFVEGPKLKQFIFSLSPLPDNQEQQIIDRFNQMNYVSLIANGLGGVAQGLLAGIGLYFAGFESVLLWTFLMIIFAFIPLLGISIITIPAAIYLWVKGEAITALFFLIYTSIVALIVENWFKPKFIGSRIQINSFFILICIMGGMAKFGMPGIFYGPLIGITFLTIVDIYHDSYNNI
ncbi:AI-2E family transporter [Bacteriovoracaceae bacterium]|nr:AI-2E family transporter [Bacteriovoracaceae bacterium]